MITILIAEDNPVNRELLRELLEGRGYAVLEACDGQEALHMVEQTHPDALLLDLGMPVLDGFATIRRIRENPRFAKLPVLAVTAYAMRGDRERVLDSGFDGYLSKPIHAVTLMEEIDRLLNRQDLRSSSIDQAHDTEAARPPGSLNTEGKRAAGRAAAASEPHR
jgi:CheY-like chemotaxis protein